MHKQLISFAQVIKFLENMNLKHGRNLVGDTGDVSPQLF